MKVEVGFKHRSLGSQKRGLFRYVIWGKTLCTSLCLSFSSVKWEQWLLLHYGATLRINQGRVMKTLYSVKLSRRGNLNIPVTWPKAERWRGGVTVRLSERLPLVWFPGSPFWKHGGIFSVSRSSL